MQRSECPYCCWRRAFDEMVALRGGTLCSESASCTARCFSLSRSSNTPLPIVEVARQRQLATPFVAEHPPVPSRSSHSVIDAARRCSKGTPESSNDAPSSMYIVKRIVSSIRPVVRNEDSIRAVDFGMGLSMDKDRMCTHSHPLQTSRASSSRTTRLRLCGRRPTAYAEFVPTASAAAVSGLSRAACERRVVVEAHIAAQLCVLSLANQGCIRRFRPDHLAKPAARTGTPHHYPTAETESASSLD